MTALSRPRPSASRTSSTAAKPAFHCTECGASVAKWAGRCPQCQSWATLSEVGSTRTVLRRVTAGPVSAKALPIHRIDSAVVSARPSGLAELDRVLGGGLIPGGVVLLAGEPGVGKSTLLLSAANAWAGSGQGPALIVTGEESAAQVRLRADRMGTLHPDLFLVAETELSAVLAHLDDVQPGLLILDSVQTISMADVDGSAGGVTQVRAVAAALSVVAKERGIACVLVGHVTKDGSIAGPRALEHLVDVVLHFEGDKNSSLRMVRGIKNRFGPADEVGCFQMVDNGIVGLADPSGLFLSGRRSNIPGTCASITMQGRRALPIELQALVAEQAEQGQRRTLSGLDASRATMVLAILSRFGDLRLAKSDVLAATVGGVKVIEPAADLALAMAVWSSARDIPLAQGLVVFGELGLSAEVRPVPAMNVRLAEAARLGFDHAIVPADDHLQPPLGVRVDQVADLGEALRAVGDIRGGARWSQKPGRQGNSADPSWPERQRPGAVGRRAPRSSRLHLS